MPKILIADTYYPDFLKTAAFNPASNYERGHQILMYLKFGTFDAYSTNLRKLGWEAVDVIVNCEPLQATWAREHGVSGNILEAQIEFYKPDLLFLQDLSIRVTKTVPIAAQCSCRLPSPESIHRCDVIFSSLPDHVKTFRQMGVRSEYVPLAFEPRALEEQRERDIDSIFVGGLGRNSYWQAGVKLFERIAEEINNGFVWYGYMTGPISDKLKSRWMGAAWGRDMYRLYQRSRIAINRHGEISGGAMNNLRCFEATGSGCLLLTENSYNVREFFDPDEVVTYDSQEDCIAKLRYYLDHPEEAAAIATRGQSRTLKNHGYQQRMVRVSEVLNEMLVAA